MIHFCSEVSFHFSRCFVRAQSDSSFGGTNFAGKADSDCGSDSDPCARWVKVTVAVGKESEEAAAAQRHSTDTEVLTMEQTGRLTG